MVFKRFSGRTDTRTHLLTDGQTRMQSASDTVFQRWWKHTNGNNLLRLVACHRRCYGQKFNLFSFFFFKRNDFLEQAYRAHPWTDFNDQYLLQGNCISLGVKSMATQFLGGQNPQKLLKIGLKRHFPAKSAISWNRNICRNQTDHYAISRENLTHQGRCRGWSKIGVKQIQDGGRPPSWKYINRRISPITGPICTKFGLRIDILHTGVIGAQN